MDTFRVFVTGANGFIGTQILLKGLELYPHLQWVATSADSEKSRKKPWFKKIDFIPYNYHEPSVNFPFLFTDQDILIHSAWGFLPFYKKQEHLTVELPAQKKFLENCFVHGLKNLCVLGTCYEYGMQQGCLNEDMHPASPVMPYPKAKVELYEWLRKIYPEIRLTWLRLFYMYGKGQHEKSLIPQLEKAVQEGKKQFDMSPGDQVRDYLRVEVMAEKIIRLALLKKNSGVVNISSGKPVRIIDFVKNYLTEKNYKIELNPGVYSYPDYEPFAFWGCTEKYNRLVN